MRNNLDEIIKERLENRLLWKNYLGYESFRIAKLIIFFHHYLF